MDFYLKATYIGPEGDHGFTKDEEYEIQVYLAEGTIKVYETPDGSEWLFNDFYAFIQAWCYVTLV